MPPCARVVLGASGQPRQPFFVFYAECLCVQFAAKEARELSDRYSPNFIFPLHILS